MHFAHEWFDVSALVFKHKSIYISNHATTSSARLPGRKALEGRVFGPYVSQT